MRAILGWLLGGVMGLVAVTSPAHGATQVLQSQRYQTTSDAKGLARVYSGGLLRHLDVDVGLVGDYERNPLVVRDPTQGRLPMATDQNNSLVRNSPTRRRVTGLLQDRLSGELSLAVGLFNWVELFGTLPLTLFQQPGEGASAASRGGSLINQFALGDVRLGGKIRILRQEDQWVDLALIPQLTLPVGLGFHAVDFARPFPAPQPGLGVGPWASGYTSEGFPTFQPELALSRDLFGFFLGGNLGLRLRRPYEALGVTITQELLGRLGAGFKAKGLAEKMHWQWLRYVPVELGVEASGVVGLNHPYVAVPLLTPGATKAEVKLPKPFQPYQHSAELDALAGLDLFWVHPYVGVGVGALPGWGTPDWRVFSGVRLSTDFGLTFPPKKAEPPADRDHDGIPDPQDHCPGEPGPRSNQGCPEPVPAAPPPPPPLCQDPDPAQKVKQVYECAALDSDGDGVPNGTDGCPLEPAPGTPDGCPVTAEAAPPPATADQDGDGIPDRLDACPTEPEDKDGFEDQDGCPDPDNDRDGVPDATDKCPLEAETINGVDDEDGCPDTGKALVKIDVGAKKIQILDKVYFDTNKATIKKQSFGLLRQVAMVLKANPEMQVVVEGHTDAQGGAAHNKKLSQDRSNSVMAFLVQEGVDAKRLTAKGYGQERPVDSNKTAKGREANRRVEFVVVEDNNGGSNP